LGKPFSSAVAIEEHDLALDDRFVLLVQFGLDHSFLKAIGQSA